MMLIEVWEMCEKYLRDNKYDGLFNDTLECACVVTDLAPCGDIQDDCAAGYIKPCHCGEHDYHIEER